MSLYRTHVKLFTSQEDDDLLTCGVPYTLKKGINYCMKENAKTITVYAASSSQLDPVYYEAATRLGALLAGYGMVCVNGAGKKGLMGALNDSVMASGGEVCGVIPRFISLQCEFSYVLF